MLTYHTDNCAAACTCEWKGKGNREGTEWLQENNKMEIKQLEYFAAAVEYGSLNRAAEKIIYNTAECEPRVKQSGKRAACDASGEKQQGNQDDTPGGRALWSRDEHLKTL